jgi:aminoglycoside 6-adenylyltransferase
VSQTTKERTAPASFDDLVERFERWASADPEVRGLAVFGSRARPDGPFDEWSDLDLIVVAEDPARILAGEWLPEIGRPWVKLVHESPVPGIDVRQVLFEGAFDVDLVPLVPGAVVELAQDPDMAAVFAQGFRPVVDDDGELHRAARVLASRPAAAAAEPEAPDEATYLWTVRDFLFQCVWSTKKLLRGELWVAKADVDGYLKEHLLRMLAWHAAATGASRDRIRPDGRYLERWADPMVVARLGPVFARYERDDVARALLETMDLFRDLATEAAGALGIEYPDSGGREVTRWIRGRLEAH